MSLCKYFQQNHCRSCELIQLPYLEQLEVKEQLIRTVLGLSQDFELRPSVPSSPFACRSKLKLSVGGTIENPVIGLLDQSDLSQVIDLQSCPLHDPELNRLVQALPKFIRRAKLTPYRVTEKCGELKSVIAFRSPESKEMYLRFVLRSREALDRLRREFPSLQATYPELQCVSVNLQPIPHAILEGGEEIFLSERRSITHTLGPVSFELAPNAFVQTNHEVSKRLYEEAAAWISEQGSQRFCELYSGQGAFSFFTASHVPQVLGIEVNPAAVEVATATARSLGFGHLRFACADATQMLREVLNFRPDVILVNPPRRGLGDGLATLRECRPRNIIYSSCSIDSLALDLRRLPEYRVSKIQLFDMFPNTRHFETLALLSSVEAV